jgi:S-DNA-T family DNA segregation ATPase FtsK/SpoIIIE
VVASSRLEGQLAVVAVPTVAERERGPAAVGVLPVEVAAGDLPPGRVVDGDLELVAGIDFETLAPAGLAVPDGEHVLVLGPARSGRSTALARLATSWRDAHPDGAVHVVAPMRRSPLASWPERADVTAALGAIERAGPDRPCLLVIDDAERVDDPGGALAALAAERRHGLLMMAAGRPDALRGFGHWTSVIRRSRTGLLLSACADVDGDLLGELLPRHPPLAARPGLAWVVGTGRRALVQLGRDADVRQAVGAVSRR